MENMLTKLEEAQISAENMTGLAKTIESAMAINDGDCNIGAITILFDLLKAHTKSLELLMNLWKESEL